MAGLDIGPRIGLDGEKEFRASLQTISQSLRTLDSEGKLLTATMEKETDAEKKSAAQKDLLQRKILTQKDAVAEIQKALEFSAKAYGESDDRTIRWQRSLNEAAATLKQMENQLEDADRDVEEIAADMGEAEADTKGWADVMKGDLLSSGIQAGLKLLKDAIKSIGQAMSEAFVDGAAFADEINTLAATTGLATDTLQEFRYMEELLDVSTDTITGSLTKLTANMSSAKESTNTAAAEFEALGVQITNADGSLRKSEDVFYELIDALNTIENETERDAAALTLLGKTAKELNQPDVSVDTLNSSMTKLIKNMSSAQEGTNATAEEFEALGVKVTNADGSLRKSEDVFYDLIDVLGKMENDTERDAAAMTLLGKSAQDLNPLIKAGSDRLNSLKQAAHDSGYVLSGSSLKALQKSKDAMDSLNKQTEALKNQFAVGLAPGVEKGAKKMEEALNNPRTQRGIEVLSKGLGELIGSLGDLAGDVLPEFLSVLNFGDIRLRTFTDEELALAQALDDAKTGWEDLTSTYKENAQAILDETGRTEALWKELQKLCDENGNVKDADADRAKFIVGTLADATGQELTMIDNQIVGYQQLREEIEKTIKMQEAEALIAAGKDSYIAALQSKDELAVNAAQAYEAIQAGIEEWEYAKSTYESIAPYVMDSSALRANIADAWDKVYGEGGLVEIYNEAAGLLDEQMQTVERYEAAQEALISENYEQAIKLMTSEYNFRLDNYEKGGVLTEKELEDLKKAMAEKEAMIAEYARRYEETGSEMYLTEKKKAEEELAELRDIYTEHLLEVRQSTQEQGEVIAAEGEKTGYNYADGIAKGIRKGKSLVEEEAKDIGTAAARATKNVLQIKSPSKVGEEIGTFFDLGIAKGTAKNGYTKRASERLAIDAIEAAQAMQKAMEGINIGFPAAEGTTQAASDPLGITFADVMIDRYAAGAPMQGGQQTHNTTINLGGLTVYAQDAQNVEELSALVADRINSELIEELAARG